MRIVQHSHAYGQIREDGRADAADGLLSEAKASDQAENLRPWTAELWKTLLDVRLILQIPVERAAGDQRADRQRGADRHDDHGGPSA